MSPANEWSIQEIARLAGTTRRTLRHYHDVGLVMPSRIGDNGYRYYDAEALVRLQRVLLLRQLGLGIPDISTILAGQRDDTAALRSHLEWLAHEQQRLGRQMASVERTITELEKGEKPMAENMFDGFDHTEYKEEVERLWGMDSYRESDGWYRSLSHDERMTSSSRQPNSARRAPDEALPAVDGRQVRRRRTPRPELRRAGRREVRARRDRGVRRSQFLAGGVLDGEAPPAMMITGIWCLRGPNT
jgi:DNA-binding transcriptional MerR regulator